MHKDWHLEWTISYWLVFIYRGMIQISYGSQSALNCDPPAPSPLLASCLLCSPLSSVVDLPDLLVLLLLFSFLSSLPPSLPSQPSCPLFRVPWYHGLDLYRSGHGPVHLCYLKYQSLLIHL